MVGESPAHPLTFLLLSQRPENPRQRQRRGPGKYLNIQVRKLKGKCLEWEKRAPQDLERSLVGQKLGRAPGL